MLAEEKQIIADFLDISSDFLGSGYKCPKKNYQFTDDSAALTDTIEQVGEEIKICRKCPLCDTRSNTVPGEGVMNPLVMVIGEGPGVDEDRQARPFVGKAGQLLDKMLSSIGLSRSTNSFIANVVKCRPPFNRDPTQEETSSCANYLERQINLLKPKFILAAGRVSAQTLLNTSEPIGKLRKNIYEVKYGNDSYPLLVIYHPAALLRNEELKRPAWEDLKFLKSKLEGLN